MSDFPIINIRNEEDVSLLMFHLNRGDKVGFTIPMTVSRNECWRLMNMINDCRPLAIEKGEEIFARVA
jgi:hypothetical protein